MASASQMNQMQLHLLQFFAQKEISPTEAEDLQRLIAQYYFEKAENELEGIMKSKNISQKDLDELAHKHHRTPYLKQ